MQINPTSQTLGQFFNVPNEQFYVPAYQRRYAWKEKQLTALFNDILFLPSNDHHLFGTIILLTETHTAGINKLEVVDGQQRIASLCLLLRVIMKKLKGVNDDIVKEIQKYLKCQDGNKTNQKLKMGDLDDPDYESIMKHSKMNKIQNENLQRAYDYFSARLSESTIDPVNFYNKLINYSTVIRLEIGLAKDAYKLFETINNRGLQLSATDIIKNFLLGHASLIDNDTLNSVRNNWKSLIINLDHIDIDKFFRHFMMGKLKIKVSEQKLSDEFKHYYYFNINEAKKLSDYKAHMNTIKRQKFDDETIKEEELDSYYDSEEPEKFYSGQKMSIIDFSKFLKNTSGVYSKLQNHGFANEEINRHLNDLDRIKSVPAYTFLLNLFQRKVLDKDKIEILELIKTFMMRRHICEYRTSELDDIFSRLVRTKTENITSEVKKELLKHLPGDQEFENKFATVNFRALENRAKYVLEQFEYHIIKDQGEYVLGSGGEVHLEHIIPQTIDTKKSKNEFGDWTKYLGENALERHKEYVWRIGNLSILARKLNIKASNNPFLAKVNEYKKSNIILNKQIVNNFKEFKFDQVEQRSKEFAKLAVEIWKF